MLVNNKIAKYSGGPWLKFLQPMDGEKINYTVKIQKEIIMNSINLMFSFLCFTLTTLKHVYLTCSCPQNHKYNNLMGKTALTFFNQNIKTGF